MTFSAVCAAFPILMLNAFALQSAAAPVRTPAEFEPVQGVAVRWCFGEYEDLYAFLVENIQAADATAYVLVENEAACGDVRASLRNRGISSTHLRFVITPTNTIWVRDYSPVAVYQDGRNPLGFVDYFYGPGNRPCDDSVPGRLGRVLGCPVYSARHGQGDFCFEGGDFMTDGFGRVFTSTLASSWNEGGMEGVLEQFNADCRIQSCIFMNQLTSYPAAHVDMSMKLVDEETLLMSAPSGGSYDEPSFAQNLYAVQSLLSCYGTPYRLFLLPVAVIPQMDVPTPLLLTYANALIVNDRVLVPSYGIPQDQQALGVYREAMPGYTIVSHDCSGVIREGGAIHCITWQIPESQVIRIGHARFREPAVPGSTIVFRATCDAPSPVEEVVLHVYLDAQRGYAEYPMIKDGDAYVMPWILGQNRGTMRYYLSAHAGGITGYRPQNALHGGFLTLDIR